MIFHVNCESFLHVLRIFFVPPVRQSGVGWMSMDVIMLARTIRYVCVMIVCVTIVWYALLAWMRTLIDSYCALGSLPRKI